MWKKRKLTAFWFVALFFFVYLIILLYEDVSSYFGEVLTKVPPALEVILGDINTVSTPEGWLGFQSYGILIPIAISIAALIMGATAIAKEEESAL